MKRGARESFLRNNGLSIVFLFLTLMALIGQLFTGWHENNKHLQDHNQPEIAVYKHSVTIALFLLFLISFMMHLSGSNKDYNVTNHWKASR